ncbi:hypothetical protein OJF2_63020 [Aquisphaera giovannonii]|uniref:DUF1398 domain-containing protein n=1 Tax=Aquisphaera giovannonii TaxID=406548 RepID=A0A5B9WCP5_9BACT|nr:DUF1398 family protein [Aquisphaera giovannonii]QEH37711.1 hypothetical protein OJF2_63020 [Aquisphaera giovannonii]
MNPSVLNDCLARALAGAMTFPETIERMIADGVERYDADLALLQMRHYGPDGGAHTEEIPLPRAPAVAAEFSAEGVKGAIASIQRREIGYPEFLRRIMAAGAAAYSVYLNGRKAIYFGRCGDFHVEPFPPPADLRGGNP